MRISDETLSTILKTNSKATDESLVGLFDEVQRTNRTLQEVALSNNIVSEEDLTKLYADYIEVPYIRLNPMSIPKDVLQRIPEQVARQYGAVLFQIDDDGTAHLAIDDPDDVQAINFIEKEVGNSLKVYIAPHQNILDCLDLYRGDVTAELDEALDEQAEINAEDVSSEEVTDNSPTARTVSLILESAIRGNASDVHIEPREGFIQVRYRIDGVLNEANRLPRNTLGPIVSRIKILATLKIDEHRVPQDGRFKMTIAGKRYALRVSTLPIAEGEKVVMRILDESNQAISLEELGYWGYSLDTINQAIIQPDGMVLVTGPTGSGKSTSLFSILTILNKPNVNISTIEDPIEYRISGVNQTQTNPQAGMTFANGLRALLRQDPNIIMVGEIRDGETASLGIQSALTGHMVFTTLHTNNAATSLPRLLDMKVEPFLIASTVRAVVGQRLVRRLCTNCRVQSAPEQSEISKITELFKLLEGQTFADIHNLESVAKDNGIGPDLELSTTESTLTYIWHANPEGCMECAGTGYRGRIGVYEVLKNSQAIQKMIMAEANSDDIQNEAIREGMITMQTDGLIKMLRGETTIEEILRVTRD